VFQVLQRLGQKSNGVTPTMVPNAGMIIQTQNHIFQPIEKSLAQTPYHRKFVPLTNHRM